MNNICYVAVERFDSSNKDSWFKYIEWSKLYQLKELVSIDSSLCPQVFDPETDDDYRYLVSGEDQYTKYSNLEWLLKRTESIIDKQILAVLYKPDRAYEKLNFDDRFEFCGYDLVEFFSGISALSNCGGFNRAFVDSELSNQGLILNFDRAKEVQELLLIEYPNESHADCDIWAIWKMK